MRLRRNTFAAATWSGVGDRLVGRADPAMIGHRPTVAGHLHPVQISAYQMIGPGGASWSAGPSRLSCIHATSCQRSCFHSTRRYRPAS
jgi:hypothetical protein